MLYVHCLNIQPYLVVVHAMSVELAIRDVEAEAVLFLCRQKRKREKSAGSTQVILLDE